MEIEYEGYKKEDVFSKRAKVLKFIDKKYGSLLSFLEDIKLKVKK